MIFAIHFLNQATQRVLNEIACLAFVEHLPKGRELSFFLFEQAQSRAHNLAGRCVSAAFQLRGNEGVEVLAKGNARVFAHWAGPQEVPIIGTVGGHNKAVKPFACGSLGHSALRTCSGMASPLFPDQALRAECRLPGR